MTNVVRYRNAVIIVVVLVLLGCQTPAIGNDVPALITNPTDESRAALQDTVNAALSTNVVIADDAFTTSSILMIERKPPRDLQGAPARGRTMDAPIQFRLVMSEAGCTLINVRDDSRVVLEHTTCTPE